MGIFTSDNFNAGTPGGNLTVDTAWEAHAGNAVYSDAGRGRISGTTSTLYSRKDVAPATADYTARATIRALTLITNASAGVAVRCQTGANTAYVGRGQHTTNTWRLERRIAGATTLLGSSSQTFSTATDYLVELDASGTTLELFAGGVSVVGPVTDSNISAAGAPGLNWFQGSPGSNTTGWHIENFEGEEAGGGTDATATGTTITATASLTAGAASGVRNATAAGATLTATASLTAGTASGAGGATALGALITATASLITGAASGVRNATASGALLAAVASLLPGSANNGELPAFTSIFGLVTRRRRR